MVGGASTARLRSAVIRVSDEVTTPVLAANHALGRELHQHKPDCRAARIQLFRELPF